jgi:hypothetical protein
VWTIPAAPWTAENDNLNEVKDMNTMKNILERIKDSYMEYVEMTYGPFDR